MSAHPVPSWVTQENGATEASTPRVSGWSKRSSITSASDAVRNLPSGASCRGWRARPAAAERRFFGAGRVGCVSMYGSSTSIAVSSVRASSSHASASCGE